MPEDPKPNIVQEAGARRAVRVSGFSNFSPFSTLRQLAVEMDRLFANPSLSAAHYRSPATEVFESEDSVVIKTELPGLQPEDINVEITGAVVAIYGKRAGGNFYWGSPLSERADTDHITAEFHNGILQVTVPLRSTLAPSTYGDLPYATYLDEKQVRQAIREVLAAATPRS